MNWLTIIVYALSLFLLVRAAQAEHLDLNCPYPNSKPNECCGDGCGMAYRGSKPYHDDDLNTLFRKIKIATRTEERTVKWRRSYMLAWIILILVWLTIFYPTYQKLPDYSTLIMFLFIATMVIYYSYSYYQFHHYDAPYRYIRESVDIIKNKLN